MAKDKSKDNIKEKIRNIKSKLSTSSKSSGGSKRQARQLHTPPFQKRNISSKELSILAAYSFSTEGIPVEVKVTRSGDDFVPKYFISIPGIAGGTKLILETKLKGELVTEVRLDIGEILDPKKFREVKSKFLDAANRILMRNFPSLNSDKREVLAAYLLQNTLGLGEIEFLLADSQLEEVVVNNSREPVWVYHKKHGWLKTNLIIPSEVKIEDYAASIGRKVGRQITTLDPLLDAHLITGDRVNATLFPISTIGNTITIRMFRRKPWTITDFIANKTISSEVAAWIWLAVQYEMSMIIAGGTASGKTSLLGAIMPFIPPNQRIISIEDTRELNLPNFLHWIPLVTREPNPEGKGKIDMLDLLVNSLRMRPDRIIVAEIRTQRQAEVLFEAMHTGHSVYATLHADTVEQAYRRLINPPINVPEMLLEALDLIVAMYRDRRLGIRRVFQIAELLPPSRAREMSLRVLFRWNRKNDSIEPFQKSYKLIERLQLHTGMNQEELAKNVMERRRILEWMVKNKINTVNGVGKVIAEYYRDPSNVLRIVDSRMDGKKLVPKELLEG